MPFTFSHPALVLPLTYLPRKWFSLTGLVAGSVAPDFEYFIRMRDESSYSHTLSGMFWFDIPLGIVLAFIFHGIVRNSLTDNLPAVFQSRLSRFKQFNWPHHFKINWLVIIISILIGAASHLFWDGFTHANGYFVDKIPAMRRVIEIPGKPLYVFSAFQHVSTIAGGLVVLYALLQLKADKNVIQPISFKYWSFVMYITLGIIIIMVLSGHGHKYYKNLVMTAISAGLISLVLTPLLMGLKDIPKAI
jgi:Domain of unknown function (DUF4184)